ncbi:DNA sulfur modification protein DndD [Ancylomarina longa]|uniref:DNA sulfur modification protein DndD n=1 Tax=Ancylomarina longa TaxID=2487017 RepID=A0A434AUK8_9BACT|nr:DNA sulfur modification protein DndD [Ancylomarina longa]RUT78026.1 DNA sulfur modification protein DndD [Ancylomarina longa]
MKFTGIKINNFRQYYGNNDIDLSTDSNKNIILIGGKNGYGKTNLLLSIVWCLYGEKISLVDENFKKEIQKEKNYSLFMKQSINWTAIKENKNTFSIEIKISDIKLPEIKNIDNSNSIIIRRDFNVSSMEENISIKNSSSSKELFEDDIDKINFINDYVIPLDAAKFVFFDAEKISEIANLSIKEEGSFINDALGKILGLDIYETLIDDLEIFNNNLKKEGATRNLQDQIIDTEKAIEISKNQIEQLDEDSAETQKRIDDCKKEIRNFNNLISQHSKKGKSEFDRESIILQIEKLKEEESRLEERFNELSEIIPLAILTGKLEEVSDHIEIQEKNEIFQSSAKENSIIVENFIEQLFNKPPEPNNSSMSLKDKMFYYSKAQDLSAELFKQNGGYKELDFEHDLNNSEKNLINDTINLVNVQSKDLFETTIETFNSVKNQIFESNKTLSKVDADLEDELILEYSSKKESTERQVSEFHQNIGINKGKAEKLRKDIFRLNQQYQKLLKRVEINQQNKLKINKSTEYLSVLKDFVYEQKELKKDSLAKNILSEMQKLMHKLNTSATQFVTDVKVTILAEGNGMKISLYNADDEEIKKEILSQGEKQLYISSLIKAILKESVQKLPIFIDTPLGRLDDEHIKNILLYYYPDLSEQVVILSTNNEITPKRYKDISSNVSKSYLLVNDGTDTIFKNGYF